MRNDGTITFHRLIFRPKPILALISGLIMVVILIGCSQQENPHVTLSIFDTSASASSDSMRERYVDIMQDVSEDLHGGDRVMVTRITDASLQDARLPIDVNPPAFNPLTQTTSSHRNRMEEARSELKSGIPSLLNRSPSKCTDLFGAMEFAGKVLQNAPSDASKRLVIASDMIETCNADFRRRALNKEDIDALIEKLRTAGRLPDLKGVRVWVAGATATTKLDPGRIQSIENFWMRYFEAVGAEVNQARYGPTLLGWKE
jgi:hypothetical protein